jgi:hypothetical protein
MDLHAEVPLIAFLCLVHLRVTFPFGILGRSIAVEQEAKLWELRAAVRLARLRRDQGRHAEAYDLLAPVYGWFTEGFGTPDLKDAKALLEALDPVVDCALGPRKPVGSEGR